VTCLADHGAGAAAKPQVTVRRVQRSELPTGAKGPLAMGVEKAEPGWVHWERVRDGRTPA